MEARPDMAQENYRDDEISLLDIYEFLRNGWKTLVSVTVLGLIAGLGLGFVLPAKFEASGLIEPAMVGGEAVETPSVMVEKLGNPSYFDEETIEQCQLSDSADPANELMDRLGPSVARNSSYVTVKYETSSPELAKQCLIAVLDDVKQDQELLARAPLAAIESQIRLVRTQLVRAVELRDQQIASNNQRLEVARQKLQAAQAFVDQFEARILQFNFKNDQFSASALLLSTLQDKQNEVRDLQIQIEELEMLVQSGLTNLDEQVFEFELEEAELQKSLERPATQNTQFVLPVYASDTKVSPKTNLLVALGVLGGGFLGLMILIGRRAIRHIRAHEGETKAH